MSRVFTTESNFKDQTYTAIVTVTGKQEDMAVSVYVPDETFHELLPGGRFEFKKKDGFAIQKVFLTPRQKLLTAILSRAEEKINDHAAFDKDETLNQQ